MRRNDGFVAFSFFLMIFSWLAFGGVDLTIWYKSYQYNNACDNYLSRAANASSVEIAKESLDTAIAYLDSHNLTSGNTDIFFNRTSNDIGFFYKNIKSARAELDTVPANNVTAESNALMKLREVIIEHGEKGEYIARPTEIYLYPSTLGYYVFYYLTLIPACLFSFLFVVALEANK